MKLGFNDTEETLTMPVMEEGNTIRLYSLEEVKSIFDSIGMRVCESYADFTGKMASSNEIQLMICSRKN